MNLNRNSSLIDTKTLIFSLNVDFLNKIPDSRRYVEVFALFFFFRRAYFAGVGCFFSLFHELPS